MKTIQQIIKEFNSKDIEKAYFSKWPVELHKIKNDEITISEKKGQITAKFQAFLDDLKNHNIDTKTEAAVLFVTKDIWNETDLIRTELCNIDELLEADDIGEVQTCDYEYISWNKALGFFVADTKLTQTYLMDVVLDFLYELSFWGYDELAQINAKEELEKSIEEFKNPENCISSIKDLYEDLDIEDDEEYPEERKYEEAYIKANSEYVRYCMNQELIKIKKLIIKEWE